MSGGGGTTNTVQTQTIPSWLQNSAQYGLNQGQSMYGQGGPNYYPGNQVAPFSPLQEQALTGVENRATQGSPVTAAAQNNATATLNGSYLSPGSNPWLDQTFQQGANAVQNRVSSEFGQAGRNLESSIPVQNDQMNQLATQVYGANYQAERANQMQTMGQANSLANNDYYGLGQLMTAGNQVQNQSQQMINQNINGYNWQQQQPYNNLNWYQNLVGNTIHGGTTTTQTPYSGGNRLGGAVGAAMLGSSLGGAAGATYGALGSAVGGAAQGSSAGPWGAAIGAGIGLLGGYFG